MSYEIARDFPVHVTVEHTHKDGSHRADHLVGPREAVVAKLASMLDHGIKYADGWSVTITPIHPANIVELPDV